MSENKRKANAIDTAEISNKSGDPIIIAQPLLGSAGFDNSYPNSFVQRKDIEGSSSVIKPYEIGEVVQIDTYRTYQVNNTLCLFISLVDDNDTVPSNDLVNWRAVGLFAPTIRENVFITDGLNIYLVASPDSIDGDSGDLVFAYLNVGGDFVEKSRILADVAGSKKVIIQFDADEDQQYAIVLDRPLLYDTNAVGSDGFLGLSPTDTATVYDLTLVGVKIDGINIPLPFYDNVAGKVYGFGDYIGIPDIPVTLKFI